jgi:tetratricopeptide (TPR) repeat protein
MGLFDAAIAELKQLATDPGHEVFALTTMGDCYEAKGTFTEAILRYKRALNCEQITAEERLILYYLLGTAFDRLGDVSEALYFFEMVAKRSPRFRDVERRIAELRPRMVKRAP